MPSGEIKKRENHTADPRADVRDASLCLILLEGPTKVAMQHAEDRSLLVHALRNAQEWQGARLPPNDGTLHAVVMVTAAWFPQARRVSASGRYSTVNRNPTRIVYPQGRVGGSSCRIFHVAIFIHRASTSHYRVHKSENERGRGRMREV